MKFFKSGAVTISVFAVLASSPIALALDGRDFGDKFVAAFGSGGIDVSYETAVVDGDSVTLSNFTFSLSGYDPVEFSAELVFTGIEELDGGSYVAKNATIDDFKYQNDNVAVSIASIVIGDLKIPAKAVDFSAGAEASKEEIRASFDIYRSFSMGPVLISFEGEEVASIASIEVTTTPDAQLNEFDFGYNISGIHADLTKAIPEPEALGMLALFGLETLDAEVQAIGFWDVESGRININENAITIKNVGRLDTLFEIDGYDLEIIQQTLRAQSVLEAGTEASPEEFEAVNTEMMELFERKLALVGFTVDFQDDGITGKILDFLAQQQGAPRQVMAAGFAAAVPAMAAEAGFSEDLQLQLLNAATAFLTDPKRLTITASPETPVKISEIAVAAEADDPNVLIDVLNISVTANE